LAVGKLLEYLLVEKFSGKNAKLGSENHHFEEF